MSNSHLKNRLLLSITTAIRLIEQPADVKLEAPDFDEHGFPVLCGSDDFYRLLTNNGRDKIVVMTFEPQQAGADEEICHHTFFIKLTEASEPGHQLLLKQTDAYLICHSDELEQFPDCRVFGVITSSAPRESSDGFKNQLLADDGDDFDEFDQTCSPRRRRNGSNSDFFVEHNQEVQTDQNDETQYDYNQDFGA